MVHVLPNRVLEAIWSADTKLRCFNSILNMVSGQWTAQRQVLQLRRCDPLNVNLISLNVNLKLFVLREIFSQRSKIGHPCARVWPIVFKLVDKNKNDASSRGEQQIDYLEQKKERVAGILVVYRFWNSSTMYLPMYCSKKLFSVCP